VTQGCRRFAISLVWLAILAPAASAQVPARGQIVRRPAEEARPEAELPRAPEPAPELGLPPIPPAPAQRALGAGLRVPVRGFRFEGNTAFSASELDAVVAPFAGRAISSEELEQARQAITAHYVEAGYVTSGALIPDQDVADGIVTIRIVEGTLAQVRVEGARWFRERYLRDRLALAGTQPVRVQNLSRALARLQRDPRVRQIHARLGPAERLGESALDVAIEEDRPIRLWLTAANDRSPSIGSERGELRLEHLNLTGNGDSLWGALAMTEGLDEAEVAYALPLNANDTTLSLRWERDASEIVEHPFDDLDIESKSQSFGVTLSHPLLRGDRDDVWVGLTGEVRESVTYLLGDRFSFAPGPEDGEANVSVLRAFQEWTRRERDQVLAARSTVSFGIDAFGATTHSPEDVPDSRFVAWLLQLQWARRFPRPISGLQLVARGDLQVANEALLSLEQFAVGGIRTVRGYRENEIVRDGGYVVSLEARVPLWRDVDGRDIVQLCPFFDLGQGFRTSVTDPVTSGSLDTGDRKTLSSIGVGLRFALPRVDAEVWYGGRLNDVERSENDLQKYGIHFAATVRMF
jgi:hemolysin activation/secretion protein